MASPNTRRNEDADDNDLYTTPLAAMEALWENAPKVLKKANTITDPCFGLGDMSRFFSNKGKYVCGVDMYNYGGGFSQYNDETTYADFLQMESCNNDIEEEGVCVMNPPFTLTMEFVDKALTFWDDCFVFSRLNTLESKKRSVKFKSKEWPLRKVWVFSGRVSCPRGVDYETTANAVVYAWYWFDKDYEGEPTIGWV